MSSPFLCVYGHTNLDHIMSLEEFPPKNTSVNILEKRRYFGGTAANVATIAASLGVPTALASFVGTDLPMEFKRLMERSGVDLSDLKTVDGYETPTVWIVSDSRHDQIAFVYQGPMGVMDRFEIVTDMAEKADHVHIMTGRPDYYLKVMRKIKGTVKGIGFDPAQEIHHVWDAERFREACSLSGYFFCNQSELLTAQRYLGVASPEEMLDVVPMIVNTIGSKGSVIYTKEGKVEIPAIGSKTIIDTTGCGDAYRAGFYAGLFRGLDLRECGIMGSAAASFVIEQRGSLTNVPNWDAVVERASPLL
ncbi:MAG: carbohydrate kinase family protein [Euryarchaeota archaeon]|nr:carbohydrate kinase family protein [Euryarchaeota archaeon]